MTLNHTICGLLSASVLVLASAIATPAFAEESITINFSTGSKGLSYIKYGHRVEELTGISSDLILNVLESGGTAENTERYNAGQVDLFTGQVEAQSLTDATLVAEMWTEYAHLVCNTGKIPQDADEVAELQGGTTKVAVGIDPTSGSMLTFQQFAAIAPSYYGPDVFRVMKMPVKDAVLNVLQGKLHCVFFVAGLNSDYARLLDKPEHDATITFIEIDKGNLDQNGYRWVQIDEDVYPNLLNGSDFDTVAVPSGLYVRPGFQDEHPMEFLALESAAVEAAAEFREKMQNPG